MFSVQPASEVDGECQHRTVIVDKHVVSDGTRMVNELSSQHEIPPPHGSLTYTINLSRLELRLSGNLADCHGENLPTESLPALCERESRNPKP